MHHNVVHDDYDDNNITQYICTLDRALLPHINKVHIFNKVYFNVLLFNGVV